MNQQDFVEEFQNLKDEASNNSTVKISDITTFVWDRVCLFPEGAKYTDVNQLVENTVYKSDGRVWGDNQLLVFLNQDVVTFRVNIPSIIFRDKSLQFWSRKGICIPKEDAILIVYEYSADNETYRVFLLPDNFTFR